LAKQYIKTRTHGHFIYISSISIDSPHTYNVVNAASKAALRFSMDVLRKELPKFVVSEICPGKTKTNMLKQNYNESKSDEEIEKEYKNSVYLTAEQVAEHVLFAIKNKIDLVKITPHV
jgi:NADP-dependent 3-hydroxy acid dehydrogenase YdfG